MSKEQKTNSGICSCKLTVYVSRNNFFFAFHNESFRHLVQFKFSIALYVFFFFIIIMISNYCNGMCWSLDRWWHYLTLSLVSLLVRHICARSLTKYVYDMPITCKSLKSHMAALQKITTAKKCNKIFIKL